MRGRRLLMVLVALMGVGLFPACGREATPATPARTPASAGGSAATPFATLAIPTATYRPPAPRQKPAPTGDPLAFEAPFSAGEFLRQSLSGSAVALQTGGQQAIYVRDGQTLVLSVYYLPSAEEAARTAAFALGGSSVAGPVGELYLAPARTYGVVQDRHGGYVAAWSQGGWAFIVRTPAALEVLDAFLAVFPF